MAVPTDLFGVKQWSERPGLRVSAGHQRLVVRARPGVSGMPHLAIPEACPPREGVPYPLCSVRCSSQLVQPGRPPLMDRCRFIGEWVTVKLRWRLTVDTSEKVALTRQVNSCPDVTITVTHAI